MPRSTWSFWITNIYQMFSQVINRAGKIIDFGHKYAKDFAWEAGRPLPKKFSGNTPIPRLLRNKCVISIPVQINVKDILKSVCWRSYRKDSSAEKLPYIRQKWPAKSGTHCNGPLPKSVAYLWLKRLRSHSPWGHTYPSVAGLQCHSIKNKNRNRSIN